MVTHAEIATLEQFFNSITIPKVVKINKAITQNDAPKFVKEKIELLKGNEITSTIAENFYHHLQQLKKAILEPVK